MGEAPIIIQITKTSSTKKFPRMRDRRLGVLGVGVEGEQAGKQKAKKQNKKQKSRKYKKVKQKAKNQNEKQRQGSGTWSREAQNQLQRANHLPSWDIFPNQSLAPSLRFLQINCVRVCPTEKAIPPTFKLKWGGFARLSHFHETDLLAIFSGIIFGRVVQEAGQQADLHVLGFLFSFWFETHEARHVLIINEQRAEQVAQDRSF